MAISLPELIRQYQEVYYLEDPSVISLLCSVVLSNRMAGDPVWLVLIGGSSSGKSELINLFNSLDFVQEIAMITPNTLLSGMKPQKGQEMSLLKQIPRQCVFLFILAQFRELYDGKMTKTTGAGKPQEWEGKITVIAGSTEKIHTMEAQFASCGVRFIYYTLPPQDSVKATKRAAQIAKDLPVHRKRLRESTKQYIELMLQRVDTKEYPVPEDVSDRLIEAADFVTLARSPVERDFRNKCEVPGSREEPMRFSNQLHNLARAEMAQNDGILTPMGESNIYKIAFDSIPKGRRLVLKQLAGFGEVTLKGLAHKLRLEDERVRMILMDLHIWGIVERAVAKTSMRAENWSLVEKYRKVMVEFEKIEYTGDILEDLDQAHAAEHQDDIWNSL